MKKKIGQEVGGVVFVVDEKIISDEYACTHVFIFIKSNWYYEHIREKKTWLGGGAVFVDDDEKQLLMGAYIFIFIKK